MLRFISKIQQKNLFNLTKFGYSTKNRFISSFYRILCIKKYKIDFDLNLIIFLSKKNLEKKYFYDIMWRMWLYLYYSMKNNSFIFD